MLLGSNGRDTIIISMDSKNSALVAHILEMLGMTPLLGLASPFDFRRRGGLSRLDTGDFSLYDDAVFAAAIAG